MFSGFPVIFFFLKNIGLCLLVGSLPSWVLLLYLLWPRVKSLKCHKFVPLNKTLSPQPAQQLEDEVEMHVIEVTKMQNDSPAVDQCDF